MLFTVSAVYIGEFHITLGPQIHYLKTDDKDLDMRIRANFQQWYDFYIPEEPLCEKIVKIEIDCNYATISCAVQYRSDIYERKKMEFNIAFVVPIKVGLQFDAEIKTNIRTLAFYLLSLEKINQFVSRGDARELVDYLYERLSRSGRNLMILRQNNVCFLNFEQANKKVVQFEKNQTIHLLKSNKNIYKDNFLERDFYKGLVEGILVDGMQLSEFLKEFSERVSKIMITNPDFANLFMGDDSLSEFGQDHKLRSLAENYLMEIKTAKELIILDQINPNLFFKCRQSSLNNPETLIAKCVSFFSEFETQILLEPIIMRELLPHFKYKGVSMNELQKYFKASYPFLCNKYLTHIQCLFMFLKYHGFAKQLIKKYYYDDTTVTDLSKLSSIKMPKLGKILDMLRLKTVSAEQIADEFGLDNVFVETQFSSLGIPYLMI